jgi:hypothetical protein
VSRIGFTTTPATTNAHGAGGEGAEEEGCSRDEVQLGHRVSQDQWVVEDDVSSWASMHNCRLTIAECRELVLGSEFWVLSCSYPMPDAQSPVLSAENWFWVLSSGF